METAWFGLDSVSGLDTRSVASKGVEENVRKRKRRVGSNPRILLYLANRKCENKLQLKQLYIADK